MKRLFFRKLCGAILIGTLMVENVVPSMTAQAAEQVTENEETIENVSVSGSSISSEDEDLLEDDNTPEYDNLSLDDLQSDGSTQSGDDTTQEPTTTSTILLSTDSLELIIGGSSQSVTVTVESTDTEDISVTCLPEDDSYAICDVSGTTLTFTPKTTPGTSIYTVSAGDLSTQLEVSVVQPEVIPVTDVTISGTLNDVEDDAVKGALNMQLNATATLTATISPAEATNGCITWTSSDPLVATVQDGTVTAVSAGRTTITATADNGVSDTLTVVVQATDTVDFYCSSKLEIYRNQTTAIGLWTYNKNDEPQNISDTSNYTYESSDNTVASVDATGEITALSVGTAKITICDPQSGVKKSLTVTVLQAAESIEVPTENITVEVGTTTRINYTVAPEDTSAKYLDKLNIAVSYNDSTNKCLEIDTDSITKNINGSFQFKALSAGGAVITLSFDGEGSTISRTINVTVVDDSEQAAKAKLTGTATMASSKTQRLTLQAWNSSNDELDVSSVGYVSSNTKVATVDANGTVTAIKGGQATITAYIMDGSNTKATFTVKVEQRPETITFSRSEYGITKTSSSSTAKITLSPVFAPTTTASKYKGVSYQILSVTNGEETIDGSDYSQYFTIKNGVVTALKAATDGMKATILCKSTAYADGEEIPCAQVTVTVQQKRVSTVKFKSSATNVIGLTSHTLAFTATYAKGYTTANYVATSSDTDIATVDAVQDGTVTIETHAYGTVTITLCADNQVTASCKVTVYPFARGTLKAQKTNYLLQTTGNDSTDKAQLLFVDSKTGKQTVAPTLFTYTSSDSAVYVNACGVAYATVDSLTKDKQVTITATLKDDPDKRKVTAKVTLCAKNQVESMKVSYAFGNAQNVTTTALNSSAISSIYSDDTKMLIMQVAPYDANGDSITNRQVNFTISDTSLAELQSSTLNAKKDTWTAVFKIKTAGRFKITMTAGDQKQYSRSVAVTVRSGAPILVSDSAGTLNKNAVKIQNANEFNGTTYIKSSDGFTLVPSDGTEIKSVSVTSAKINKSTTIGEKYVNVLQDTGDSTKYYLVMDADKLSTATNGTYEITLKVTRTLVESVGGMSSEHETTESIKTTYTITSSTPKLSALTVTLNSFIEGDKAKLSFDTDEAITNVTLKSGMQLANDVTLAQDGSDWYVSLADFENWKKTSTSGKLQVAVEGYENPAEVKLTVKTKTTKPVVKQKSVPSVWLSQGAETTISLVDGSGDIWTDYEVECVDAEGKRDFEVSANDDGTIKLTLNNTETKIKKKSATYTEKIKVSRNGWRSPIELKVSVKTYGSTTTTPKVTFAKSTVYINRTINETSVEVPVSVNLSNVTLSEGEGTWTITDERYSSLFNTTYSDGVLQIALSDADTMSNGTYRLTFQNVWSGEPTLKTSALKVVVRTVQPQITAKVSGSMNLLKRSTSPVQVKVTVGNVNTTIQSISLGEGLSDRFYSSYKDNTIKIYAKGSAQLTTKKVTGYLNITLSNGGVLSKQISFTPVQTTPKVTTPANKKIYKSSSTLTADYNFKIDLEKGVSIRKIEAVSIPSGLTAQYSRGHLLVTLTNKTLKAGKYKITVNVYFNGAQATTDSTYGKPVQKTIYVLVKE